MLRQMYNLFGIKDIPHENQLQVEFKYHVDYGTTSSHGYGGRMDVNEELFDKIQQRIYITPGKNPVITMTLTLTGYWNDNIVDKQFEDIDSLKNYLADNKMVISECKKLYIKDKV